jgi:hypothetical protein
MDYSLYRRPIEPSREFRLKTWLLVASVVNTTCGLTLWLIYTLPISGWFWWLTLGGFFFALLFEVGDLEDERRQDTDLDTRVMLSLGYYWGIFALAVLFVAAVALPRILAVLLA